ncbi:SACE_7040 family transcriptional regulator [Frankia tisae]|uniref:SACE_7040 family transcriptional regulator n=1 Tax=Frankia tisae TaxID=2950104 RepID=UPI0021C20D65|nr:TetR/AcrR family transcriptional regulator [Frankia tisae]
MPSRATRVTPPAGLIPTFSDAADAAAVAAAGPPAFAPVQDPGPTPAEPDPAPLGPAPTAASPVRRARTGRRDDLLQAAARLFAERGFRGVGIEQIGAAVGIRGPGIYRHFASKDAMLTELLVGISQHLLQGAQTVLSTDPSASDALDRLVRRHVEFAVGNPDLIVIHDRDLHSLPAPDEHEVRRLQRAYVELWVGVLRRLRPELTAPAARVRAHAIFGLINSTPHSSGALDPAVRATTLHSMATAAATA